MSSAPLFGLVLAGGQSSRMQRDKAALLYHGKPQLDRVFELVASHTERAYVSVRSGQATEPLRASYPTVIDSIAGSGPIVGIRSAFALHPGVAWLVVACDLPFLSGPVIEYLLKNRNPSAFATAYRSRHDGMPEPLCTVWEPTAAAAMDLFTASGKDCPRKFLITHAEVSLLDLQDERALDNVNTPQEYTEASQSFEHHAMTLKVQYFALMREQAGRSEEVIESKATTPAALYSELVARYGFTLSREQLKVAVNSEFAEWSRPLASGDAVVFIPPVAGG